MVQMSLLSFTFYYLTNLPQKVIFLFTITVLVDVLSDMIPTYLHLNVGWRLYVLQHRLSDHLDVIIVWGLLVRMCDLLWPRDHVSFIIGFYLTICLMKSDILEVRCGPLANESILITNHYMLSTYLYVAHNSICCISYVINIYCVVQAVIVTDVFR